MIIVTDLYAAHISLSLMEVPVKAPVAAAISPYLISPIHPPSQPTHECERRTNQKHRGSL